MQLTNSPYPYIHIKVLQYNASLLKYRMWGSHGKQQVLIGAVKGSEANPTKFEWL